MSLPYELIGATAPGWTAGWGVHTLSESWGLSTPLVTHPSSNPPSQLPPPWGSSWVSRPGAGRPEEHPPGVAMCWPACTGVAPVWGDRSPCPRCPEGESSPAWPRGWRRPGGVWGGVRPGQGYRPAVPELGSSGARGRPAAPAWERSGHGAALPSVSRARPGLRPPTQGAFAFVSTSCGSRNRQRGGGWGETESAGAPGAPRRAGPRGRTGGGPAPRPLHAVAPRGTHACGCPVYFPSGHTTANF